MLIALHKNATTMPATRQALQQASGTERELAQQYGIGVDTVRKWRRRTSGHDASYTAHRLQTTLNAVQEELVIYLRTQLLLPLDDLLAVVREFIEPAMSRSALGRLLRRRGGTPDCQCLPSHKASASHSRRMSLAMFMWM